MSHFRPFFFSALLLAALTVCGTTASADEGFGVGVKIGTMGAGAEISAALVPNTRIRGGINYLTYEFDSTIDSINYDFDTQFNSVSALLDIHPFGGAFFLSGGVYFNNNSVDVKGTVPPDSFPADYRSFDFLADYLSISGEVEFMPVAPYVGLGWRSNSGEPGWGIGVELGVLYQGAPDVKNLRLNAPVDINDISEVQQFLKQQEKEIEDELSWFEWYPVASLMLTYHF